MRNYCEEGACELNRAKKNGDIDEKWKLQQFKGQYDRDN